MKELLLRPDIRKNTLLEAFKVALEKKHWITAKILSEHPLLTETEKDVYAAELNTSFTEAEMDGYAEMLKKGFLQASYKDDIKTVKFYLEKLIENAVGALTDETGKSTLEIALENPEDMIKILSGYGFNKTALQYAYNCLIDVKQYN